MKISEIITEAINYTRHIHTITNIVYEGILEAIKTLGPELYQYSSVYEPYRQKMNTERSVYIIRDRFKTELRGKLQHYVGKRLENIAAEILEIKDAYVPVEFKSMKAGGQAPGLSVTLNTKFIEELTERIYDLLFKYVESGYSGDEDFYDYFWRIIRKTDWSDEIKGDRTIPQIIYHWSSIFIHELVHLRQHRPQLEKGRLSTEYRSYLDKFKGEFLKLHSSFEDDSDYNDRWWDLYKASPQEISARAHQAALTILDYYIKYPDQLEYFDAEELRRIYKSVPEFIAHSYYKKPETPRERLVYRRYIQKTIEQINDFISAYSSKKIDENNDKLKFTSDIDNHEYFDTPRIRNFIKKANDIVQKLPPVKDGYTRLWRGNRPGEVGKNPSFTNSLIGIALPFLEMYGGKLSYVDVKTQNLSKWLSSGAPGSEFILPKQIASKAIVV